MNINLFAPIIKPIIGSSCLVILYLINVEASNQRIL